LFRHSIPKSGERGADVERAMPMLAEQSPVRIFLERLDTSPSGNQTQQGLLSRPLELTPDIWGLPRDGMV
jgi:hypothetical protein